MEIILADTDAQIGACFPVMALLQPSMAEADFIARVALMQKQGFQMASLRDGEAVRAVACFRLMEKLFSGRILYLEDLVTDSAFRSRGYGTHLLTWLCDYARAQECAVLKLNCAVQQADAHRFYFAQRMHIAAYHFMLPLDTKPGE